ncbi:MAG: hypothetical protein ACT4OU_05555 [Hyphomicrobium sp.]
MRERRLQRNLKFLVGFLGALILACLAAVVAGIMLLPTKPPAELSTPAEPGASRGAITFELPKGAKVVSVSLSVNRVAVHHDGPGGAGISILDLETGKRVIELRPVETAPPYQ